MRTAGEYGMLTIIMPHTAVGIGSYALLPDVSKQRHLGMPLRPAGLPSQDCHHWFDSSAIKIRDTYDDTVTKVLPMLSFNGLVP
jgi:hypothetical protein